MTKMPMRVTLICCTWLLASCSTPFFAEGLTKIDWSGPPAAGTIAVSQPKMYRRESLINERRDEIKWLDDELKDSKTIKFEPELVRETEQIKQLAVALGLSFDPASAVNYRRAAETGDIQQQIEVLKMQLQLDQLRRDAQLLRAGLADQTMPLNSDLGIVSSTGPAAAVSPAGTAAAGKLTEAIDRIDKDLTTRLATKADAAAKTNTTANPSDLFRDRSAYRDLLKSARNAASLDDLHDHGGSELFRLNFQVMVLPERDRARAPGVVQMTIKEPKLDADAKEQLYRGWLEHLNQKINRVTEAGWEPDGELVYSQAADNFDLIAFCYPQAAVSRSAPPAPQKANVNNQPVSARIKSGDTGTLAGHASPSDAKADAPPTCIGCAQDRTQADTPCATLVFAVPKFKGGSLQEGAYSSLDAYLRFSTEGDDQDDQDKVTKAHELILAHAQRLVRGCALPNAGPAEMGVPPDDDHLLLRAIQEAQVRAAAGDEFARVKRQAQQMLRNRNLALLPETTQSRLIADRAARSHALLRTFEEAAYGSCSQDRRAAFRKSSPSLYVPQGFLDALAIPPRVSVYEIGPREQVQQVSTVSRVANNLSLALALAGSTPRTGFGANALTAYSSQAMGRAAALERVPGLIGYATTSSTFGWVIAPRAIFDPKGAIVLEQTPRALDLSVELSVPGWWPSFTIVTTTGWAPDAAAITGGTVIMGKPQEFIVPMASNYADFDELTVQIKHSDAPATRKAALDDSKLTDQFVAACRATSLYLKGANIWRATSVVIGGHRLDEAAITVAPDMSGILLAVPALDELVSKPSGPRTLFTVFTRYGDASGDVDYVPRPVPDGCKAPEKPADPDAPVIASVTPADFKGGSELWFTVQGSKLDKIDGVTINGQPGEITTPSKDGKSLKAKFTAVQTKSLPVSRTIPLSFFAGDKKLAERLVENRH